MARHPPSSACDAGDTTAPSTNDPAVSAARGPTGQACVGCPVVSSHILFAADKGSTHNDIYSMNPDGTGRKVVVASQGDEHGPAQRPTNSASCPRARSSSGRSPASASARSAT